MARGRMGLAGLIVLAFAAHALARDIEITRSCFPGFCVESRQAFTVLRREPKAGKHRLLLSREQAVLYIETGAAPDFPKCIACTVEERTGERIARHHHNGRIMARLMGPFEGCRGAAPFYIHVFVYLPLANPGAVSVERNCEASPLR